jgi:integrase/recombinase XerC
LALDLTDRDRTILTVFMYAGLRANELRMLDAGDIDFETETIFVRYGKRDKQRIIPLHRAAGAALGAHLGGRMTGPTFESNRGQRISYDRLHSLVADLGRQAGLRKEIHPHVLRHTFAVMLREAGEELDVIKTLLGHASIKTTEIYVHCVVSQLRVAVDKI